MKKGFFYLLLAATSISVTSCDNDNGIDTQKPEIYSFATVKEIAAEKASDEEAKEESIYFLMDSQKSFIVAENKSSVDYSSLEEGDRVIAGVTLEKHTDDTYDYSAELYEIIKVILGESQIINSSEELEQMANDAVEGVSKSASLTQGYLNLYVEYTTEDTSKVEFHLIENCVAQPVDEGQTDDEEYLSLELRYNSSSEEGEGKKYTSYVSFDVESLRESLEGKTGISLRINAGDEEAVEMEIDSKDLFEDKE